MVRNLVMVAGAVMLMVHIVVVSMDGGMAWLIPALMVMLMGGWHGPR